MSEASTTENPSTDPAATTTPSTAVAVRPAREVRVVEDDRAVWSTGDFEHMGRVASVMTDSHLLPESFRGERDGGTFKPFERTQVVASALVLCTIAREFEANPFLLMQCASLISGRIMLEGKVIAAAIEHRTGIRLKYEFGLWDTDHFEPVSDPSQLNGAGERLAVRVIGRFADESEDRTVAGSVGQWKTTRNGSPWSKVGDWPRQLRYRGAREWGRAHAPGVTLGMFGDGDDFEDDPIMDGPKARTKRDLAGKLTAKGAEASQEGAQGFNRAGVAQALGDAPSEAPAATDEAHDAEFTDDTPEPEPKAAVLSPHMVNGPAPRGEQYFMFGDTVANDGRRITYKDGERFSTTKLLTKFTAYTEHAPEKIAEQKEPAEDTVDLEQPCEACGAAAGEDCKPDCPGLIEAGGAGETDDDADAEGLAGASEAQDALDAEPETGFLATLTPMKSWAEIKAAVAALFKTSDYQSADESEKNELRRAIWAHVERVRADHGDKVDHAEDVTAFGLWMTTQSGRDGADAIRGTLNVIKASEPWKKLSPANAETLEKRAHALIAAHGGAVK